MLKKFCLSNEREVYLNERHIITRLVFIMVITILVALPLLIVVE